MEEQQQHAAQPEPDVAEPPPVQAALSCHGACLHEQGGEDAGAAHAEQQVAAPLLPEPVEPKQLEQARGELIRHGHTRCQQRRRHA